jgi:hypothetical protein
VGCYEHGSGLSGVIKGEKFLDPLNNSALWSLMSFENLLLMINLLAGRCMAADTSDDCLMAEVDGIVGTPFLLGKDEL